MKNRGLMKRIIITLVTVICLLTAAVAVIYATDDNEKENAMTAIEAAFTDYKIGDTTTVSSDGYIGIPVNISTYYDSKTHGTAKNGYNGTPVIIYVINTNIERIGAKSDVDIITSMLERGYIVTVLDYLNNDKAVSPDLDWSTQKLRSGILAGNYFSDKTVLPSGTYKDTFVVPAGYDVSYGNIFWEADKHGADGTLEKIVENWNTDFRGWFAETVIYWCDSEGNRKATQNCPDGTSPVWLNADGTENTDGNYIKLKYTLAEDITDCVGKDGVTPIDLNLYMHVVYPTTTEDSPIASVPVIALANSSEYLANGLNTADRPQFSGFLFNGYAGVVYDYLYQPMAQADYFGYYDGRTAYGAMTGDRMNYGLQLYNDKRINTAAMRYIRYLTLTNPTEFSFDIDKIGVYGNSKGGWFTFLGEAELREYTVDSGTYTADELAELIDTRINDYTSKRVFDGHNGETRYQIGDTEDRTENGVTIDGGELQPWLTYTDSDGSVKEILSYASWIYASNGGNDEDITEGHAPVFSVLHLQDDFSTVANSFGEVSGCLDIPSFYFVVDLGHTFTYGPDVYYGVDTYQAMFDFANYYLRGDAVKVVYTSPAGNTGNLDTTSNITIKFSGAVPENEISKVTLVSESGETVTGSWSAIRGMTEWTFEPTALSSATKYTLTVPASLAGDNGKGMAEDYTAVFYTETESVSAAATYKSEEGAYFVISVPDMSAATDAKIRFHVANEAANVAALYEVSGFDSSNPSSATIGALVDSVNLVGSGYYEIDVTDYVAGKAVGEELVFLLKSEKTSGEFTTYEQSFGASYSAISINKYARAWLAEAPDGTAATKIYLTTNVDSSGNQQYAYETFYANTNTIFTNSKLFGASAPTEADLGRTYKVNLRVYDTESRVIQLILNGAYDSGVHDFNRVYYNLKTTAGEWVDISFDYTVYEPDNGDVALAVKTLTVKLETAGADESPIYIDSLTVTEYVTDITLASDAASLVLGSRGDIYVPSDSEYAFSVGGNNYLTLKEALSAATSGSTVTMLKNYTLNGTDNFTDFEVFESITIDLAGYKLYTDSDNSLLTLAATSVSVPRTDITVKNGSIYLSDAPLVSYNGSSLSGDGKVFNVNLESVYIMNADNSRLTYAISAPSVSVSSDITANIALSDSVIDIAMAKNTKTPITVFSNGSSTLSVNYSITGGKLVLDTMTKVTLWDAFKKTVHNADSDGNYMTLSIPASATAPETSVMRDDAIAVYTLSSTSLGVSLYTAQITELSTKYGIIPESYSDKDTYPFVIFDENGNFIAAAESFHGSNGSGGATGYAKSYVANAYNGTSYETDKTAYIVMRRNYTYSTAEYHDNLAQIQGTVYVDLGGFTLSSGSTSKPMMALTSKGFSGAAGTKIFPTTIVFENGTMLANNTGIMTLSTWDSIGDGSIVNKDFNLIFNGVTFGTTDTASAESLMTHFRDPSSTAVAAPFNLTYNDCTFDLRTQAPASNMRIFTTATDGKYIKLTALVNGGKIIADDPSVITVLYNGSDNYGSSVTFGKGSDGKYLSYVVPESASVSAGSYSSAEGNLSFVKGSTLSGDTTYNLETNPLETPYGTIPEAYASTVDYPFALFDAEGNFLAAYSLFLTYSGAVNKAKGHLVNNTWDSELGQYVGKGAVVVMRRDYTLTASESFDNWSQIMGEITIDLGGYTLSQNTASGSSAIFSITSKGWSYAAGVVMYPTTINIKNGAINTCGEAAFSLNMWQSDASISIKNKIFTLNIDNVEFGFTEGASSSNLLINYQAKDKTNNTITDAAPFIFNFNNCTFDLKTNASSASSVTLFNAAPSDGYWVKNTVTVNGGEIIADDWESKTMVATENVYGSSVTFGKNSDGEYTKLYVTNGASYTPAALNASDGTKYFVKTSVGTTLTLYTLVSLTTDYGDIPIAYASVLDYPFAVFDSNGKFIAAKAQLMGSQSGAIGTSIYSVLRDNNTWNPETGSYGDDQVKAYILMRRDYTLLAAEYHNNLAHAQGTVVLDLGAHTLYQDTARTSAMFDATAKGWSGSDDGNLVFPSTYIVKNGEIRIYSAAVIRMKCNDSVGNNTIANKKFTWQFDNVTFGLQKGATATSLVNVIDNAQTTSGVAPFSIIFNDCIFDLQTVAPTAEITIFNANSVTKNYIDCDITVNGGMLLAGSLANINYYSLSTAHGSSILFCKGEDGKYLSVTASAYPDTTAFTTAEGEATFTLTNESNVYTLELSEITKYGNIPARYTSAAEYPYIVFRNGKFVLATSIFGKDASASALHNSKSNGSVILLRRDVDYTESQYNNLSQTNGSITIDLNGYTISMKQTGTNPWLYAQKKTQYDSSVTVINGTLLNGKNELVRFDCWQGSNGTYTGGNYFNITFENVTIGVLEGYSPSNILLYTQQNQVNAVETNATLTLNNCVIDLSGVTSGTLISADDPSLLIDTVVTINSTKIIADDLSGITLVSDITNEKSSVTWSEASMYLPAGVSVTTEALVTENGEKVFVRTGTDGSYVVYELADESLTTFTPKVSVTLYSDFIFNVYIPVRDDISSIVFDDKEHTDLNGFEISEIDGVKYYKLTKTMAAAEAAENVILKVTLNLESGESVNGTFTMGIVKYAQRILAGDYTDTEKALMKDMLAYIKAAYTYFDKDTDGSISDMIDAIIGVDYSSSYTDIEAGAVSGGLDYATMQLGTAPAFIFYPETDEDGSLVYAAESYIFKSGSKMLNGEILTDGKGKTYIKVTVYAYGMCETVSYSIADTEISGTYNIRNYHSYAEELADEELVALVELLWRYSESAKAYKSEVTAD